MVNRRDPDKHKEQVRLGSKARTKALSRLVKSHKKEFDEIYAEEAQKLGILPRSKRRKAKIERLQEEIEKLKEKDDESAPDPA